MRRRKAPAHLLRIAGMLALGVFCIGSAQLELEAGILSPNFKELNGAAAPLVDKVRRRFRRYHRLRPRSTAPSQATSSAPESGDPRKDVQGPPTPPVSGKVANQSTKLSQPPAGEGKDIAAAKPPESNGPPSLPNVWTTAEVQAGRLDCDRRLGSKHILFDSLDPIKEGACGSPAPIRLRGFNGDTTPALAFSPAPTVSCKLTEALRHWFDDVVQPKAKAHLNATIVSVVDLSAYSCRSRYDDSTQRISQHAYANAIDISEFVTAKGEHIRVLDGWNATSEASAFLHEIHGGACEIFGTTLGPEANEAHKNHFHLDMIDRRRPLCDFTPAQVRAREEAKKHPVVPVAVPGQVPSSGESSVQTPEQPTKPKPESASQEPRLDPKTAVSEPAQPRRRYRRRSRHFVRF